MFFGFWDFVLIPAILVSLYASSKVNSTYKQYSQVPSKRGFTGADVARFILNQNGLHDVPIEVTGGHLSDHYDPRARACPEAAQGNSGRAGSVTHSQSAMQRKVSV